VGSSLVGYDGGQNVREERRVAVGTSPPSAPDPNDKSEKRSSSIPLGFVVFAAIALGGVVEVFIYGYLARPGWVGVIGKTIWDYLDVFLVPVAVGVATAWLTWEQNRRQRKDEAAQQERQRQADAAQRERELEVENQRAQDAALQAYLDQMSQLLTDKDRPLHRAQPGDSLSTIARARTLTVLTRLKGNRKGSVVRFLHEAGLIAKDRPILLVHGSDLRKADLREADLSKAYLSGANFGGTNLWRADLSGADLSEADLSEANLLEADLKRANLSGARLTQAYLDRADLSEADLSEADLTGAKLYWANLSWANLSRAILPLADLSEANLSGANLSEACTVSGGTIVIISEGTKRLLGNGRLITNEELEQQTRSLEGATMPTGQKYEDWLKDKKAVHALSVSVSDDDWRRTERTGVLYFEGPEGGQVIFTRPFLVYEPRNLSELKVVPAPESASEWISWFQRHPGLKSSDPVSVTVADAPGVRIDVMPSSKPENYPRYFCVEAPCVPLFPPSTLSAQGWKDRFFIVDVYGRPVVIDVAAPTDKFEEFLPEAQKVLDKVEWKNGGPS
jgi:uncharacterized protein YjbI with pentapeptide repeats